MPQQLILCSRTWEPKLLSPYAATTKAHVPGDHALQQEKPPQSETYALQLESGLYSLQLEKNQCSKKDSAQPNVKLNK